MNGAPCQQRGCNGVIEDGYCNICGHAEAKAVTAHALAATAPATAPASARASFSSAITTGTGSTPVSRSGKGTRRTSHSTSRTSRKQLGAGLITLPDLPSIEPERAIMLDPKVPERKRFCARCDSPLKREAGFCGKCGARYNFVPALHPGDLVSNQYEVRGPIAFGGLGWIYLGFDRILSRYVVLKGLLNTQDESAAAAAVAERQFLAAVKHSNIVGIYNFVQNGGEGFIVMEYVGGKTLKQIRQERGPLPPAEAVAYIHRILSAFAYLHRAGLVYCDFKPDNVMVEKDDVKLIDMGGVRRIDDLKGDIYGTVGYSAPEAAEGPTAASDLFTVGRTLAVLLTEIHGFSKEHLYTLPNVQEAPVFANQESLYRVLLKATAQHSDDRFESADDMAEQLLGVLREIVSIDTGVPRPSPSVFFGGDLLSFHTADGLEQIYADHRYLPVPSFDMTDPGAQAAAAGDALGDPFRRANALRVASAQFPKSREVPLRLAAALIDGGEFADAVAQLKRLAEQDAWDWRVLWFQARMKMTERNFAEARKLFDQVYFDLPGELAPKLALGVAAELSSEWSLAISMYDLVSRTDPGLVSAVFGLARCHHAKGERQAAVTALHRIPPSSAMYTCSRVEAARLLIERNHTTPTAGELAEASAVTQSLALEGRSKHTLDSHIYRAALDLITSGAVKEDRAVAVLGGPLQEPALRRGLEISLRSMARMATSVEERVRLVDHANQVRPRTLV
jgi:serine/threonine-protein kinase PknG